MCFYQFYWFCFPFPFDSGKIIETSILQIKYNMKNTSMHTYLITDLYSIYINEHKNYIYSNLSYNMILSKYSIGLKSNKLFHQIGDHILNQFISIKFM